MITVLQRHIHRHGKLLLILVVGVVVVSMLYFGPARAVDEKREQNIRIYGRKLSRTDLEKAREAFAFDLTLKFGRPFHRNNVDNEKALRQILLNMALVEKARRLGIQVSDEEIARGIKSMPVFQVDGRFNQEMFDKIMSGELPQRRLNENDLKEIISDQICIQRLDELVSTTALVAPDEVDEYLQLINEKIGILIAKFDQKIFRAAAVPKEEELRAFYNSNLEKFRVGKQIKALYVEFPIAEAAKGIEVPEEEMRAMYEKNLAQFIGKDGKVKSFDEVKPLLKKAVVQQKAIDQTGRRATDFSLKFAVEGPEKADFRALAAKENLKVSETAFVSDPSQLKGISAPDQFFHEIMKLSRDNPVSLPIVGNDVIYVAHWEDTRESYAPEFKDVRDRVAELWKNDWSLKTARETGLNKRNKFEQLLAEKKSFDQAAKTLGIAWENVPPFSLREIGRDDPSIFYKQSAKDIPVGGVGVFQPGPFGGFFIYVENRQPADPGKLQDQRREVAAFLEEKARNIILYEFRKKVIEESELMPLFAKATDESRSEN